MRNFVKVCMLLLFCLSITLTVIACDFDPYKNQRPIEYDNSTWVCTGENYEMSFEVGNMAASKLIVNEEELCSFDFLFGEFDNSVIVYKFNGNKGYKSEDILFKGSCVFGKNKFTISIEERCNIPDGLPNELIFERK